MQMDVNLLAGFGMALYVAWGIGSNDATMATLAGSGFLNLKSTALLGGVMAFLGAVLLGQRVEATIGKNLLLGSITVIDVLIILFSTATWSTIASYRGWPISTTHSAVGAVMGLGLIKLGLDGIAWETLSGIAMAWAVSPLIGLIGALVLSKLLKWILRRRVHGLRQQMEISRISAFLLLFWASLTSFSRGANDVANVTAFLSNLPQYDPLLVRAIGGVGMTLGLVVLGRKVIRSVGSDLVELNPVTALAPQISVALTMFIGTWFGLPLSGTHILVGAIIGLGLAEGIWMNIKGITKILYIWVATFTGAAGITVAIYLIINLF